MFGYDWIVLHLFSGCNNGEAPCPVNGTVECVSAADDADRDCIDDETVSEMIRRRVRDDLLHVIE